MSRAKLRPVVAPLDLPADLPVMFAGLDWHLRVHLPQGLEHFGFRELAAHLRARPPVLSSTAAEVWRLSAKSYTLAVSMEACEAMDRVVAMPESTPDERYAKLVARQTARTMYYDQARTAIGLAENAAGWAATLDAPMPRTTPYSIAAVVNGFTEDARKTAAGMGWV